MNNPEFVLENETLKLLLYFEIKTDHQILARRPDPMDFAVQVEHGIKLKEIE